MPRHAAELRSGSPSPHSRMRPPELPKKQSEAIAAFMYTERSEGPGDLSPARQPRPATAASSRPPPQLARQRGRPQLAGPLPAAGPQPAGPQVVVPLAGLEPQRQMRPDGRASFHAAHDRLGARREADAEAVEAAVVAAAAAAAAEAKKVVVVHRHEIHEIKSVDSRERLLPAPPPAPRPPAEEAVAGGVARPHSGRQRAGWSRVRPHSANNARGMDGALRLGRAAPSGLRVPAAGPRRLTAAGLGLQVTSLPAAVEMGRPCFVAGKQR